MTYERGLTELSVGMQVQLHADQANTLDQKNEGWGGECTTF